MKTRRSFLAVFVAFTTVSCSTSLDTVASCGAGTRLCDNACVSVLDDDQNCGDCGVACAPGESCVGGSCLAHDCDNATCSAQQVCEGSRCTERACVGTPCGPGTGCHDGVCYPDSCAGVPCGAGEICFEGACRDFACEGVTCPSNQTCIGGACHDSGCDGGLCPPPALSISPPTVALPVNGTTTFTASGGAPPYTFAVASGSGSVSTGGSYTAPATAGSAVVRVSDSDGGTADADITIHEALSISPATASLLVSTTQTFTASGGVPPYAFAVVSGTGGITSAGVYTAPATAGTEVVRVADSLGSTSSATVTVTTLNDQCSVTPVTWRPGLYAYGGVEMHPDSTPVHTISPGEMQSFSHQRASSRGYVFVAYGQPMIMTVSSTPCDFSTSLLAQGCYCAATDPMVMVRTSDFPPEPGECTVPENGTFYINIRLMDYIEGSHTYYLVH